MRPKWGREALGVVRAVAKKDARPGKRRLVRSNQGSNVQNYCRGTEQMVFRFKFDYLLITYYYINNLTHC